MSSTTQTTRGPWLVYDPKNPPRGTFVNVCTVDSIAVIAQQEGDDLGTPEGDATLIAAAPDMADVLRELILKRLEKSSSPEEAAGSDGRYARAIAVLTKAGAL